MGNNISKLEEVITRSFRDLESQKAGWNDNVQKSFYDTKVEHLHSFLQARLDEVESIDIKLKTLDNKMENI